jgi:putative restriction endonuclease
VTPLQRTRLEKAAADCGFEFSPAHMGESLVLRSANFPETVSISVGNDEIFVLTASHPRIMPGDRSSGTLQVQGFGALYDTLQRMAATARTLPNRVADKFAELTTSLPRATEAERLIVQRVGQNLFRNALLDYWRGRCCVTGLEISELLRASHIKPWALCTTDAERLDVFNGLLLAPHLDALFDGGWITVLQNGDLFASASLPSSARILLALNDSLAIQGLRREHESYLAFHRAHVFRG